MEGGSRRPAEAGTPSDGAHRGRLAILVRPRRWPLFWRLLAPALAVLIAGGLIGSYVVLRLKASEIETKSTARKEQSQSQLVRAVDRAATDWQRQAIQLSEVPGLASILERRDAAGAARILAPLTMVSGHHVRLIAIADSRGQLVVARRRLPIRKPGARPKAETAPDPVFYFGPHDWSAEFVTGSGGIPEAELEDLARLALERPGAGEKAVPGLLRYRLGGFIPRVIAYAAPICAQRNPCVASGVAIVGGDYQYIRAGSHGALLVDNNGQSLVTGTSEFQPPPDPREYRPVTFAPGLSGFEWVPGSPRISVHGLLFEHDRYITSYRSLSEERSQALRPIGVVWLVVMGLAGIAALGARLQSRLVARTAEVRKLSEERSRFFAMLSHDLRTPVAVMLAQTDLLQDSAREGDEESVDDAADAIRGSGGQLLRLVNDIIEVARAESGELEVEPVPLDLGALIDELLPTLNGCASAGRVNLSVSVETGLPRVSADPTRLREVVINLVDNAVKYTPAGGSVDVAAQRIGKWVELTVADTGVGIPAEVGDRIFEPFYRVKGNAPQHGESSSGLGLALAHRLMLAQGGALRYRSTDQGSLFIARLAPAPD